MDCACFCGGRDEDLIGFANGHRTKTAVCSLVTKANREWGRYSPCVAIEQMRIRCVDVLHLLRYIRGTVGGTICSGPATTAMWIRSGFKQAGRRPGAPSMNEKQARQ